MTVVAGDADLAADCVAEAFSRAYERWDRIAPGPNPTGWVYRVAMNVVRRQLRRRAVEARLLRRVVPATVTPPADVTPELWAEVAALPQRQREAVALRYVADLSEAEVAQVLGVAVGTASSTLTAARRRLADRLAHLKEAPWT